MSERRMKVKHIIQGGNGYPFVCSACLFTTRSIEEAAEHDGTITGEVEEHRSEVRESERKEVPNENH